MALDLSELVAVGHTALVLQEVQNGVVGEPSVLPELATAGARVGLIEHCAALAARARAIGVPVFHCTAETRSDLVRRAIDLYLYRISCERDAKIYEDLPLTVAELAGGDDPKNGEASPPW